MLLSLEEGLELEQDLHPIMEEMAVGIKQLIADARTAENATYYGFDGTLLSQGDCYTYQFFLHTSWDPEENSRIYVELAKGAPFEQQLAARVISRIGTVLECSTRDPITVRLLKRITLIEDRTWLLERQLEVVQRYLDGILEEAPGEYGAKVLQLRPVKYGRKRVTSRLGSFILNAEQHLAIEQGLDSDLTYDRRGRGRHWQISSPGPAQHSISAPGLLHPVAVPYQQCDRQSLP